MRKKLFLILFFLILPAFNEFVEDHQIDAQSSLSYGASVSSLNTTSAGAVTGTVFSIPTTYAALLTWQVVADGSALSVNLEGSLDNVTYFTVDSITTAAGGVKNFGFSAVKFVRCSQVSRTGGTSTTCTISNSRGFITSGTGNLNRTLVGDGSGSSPSMSFLSTPTTGFYKYNANNFGFSVNGISQEAIGNGFYITSNNSYNFSSSATDPGAVDSQVTRIAAGQISAGTSTVQPVINGTLTTLTTGSCTIADVLETTLLTYTLPAGALNANGRGIRVTAWGNFGATANNKTIRLYFGATSLIANTVAGNNVAWEADGVIFRTGATTQIAHGTQIFQPNISSTANTSPAETLANAIVIKVTGQNGTAAANDSCGVGMIVETIK